MKRSWTNVMLVVMAWLVVGLVLSLEVYFNARSDHKVDLWELAIWQYTRAILWACLIPFILWLRRAVPLGVGNYVGGILFHVSASVMIMLAYYLVRIAYFTWQGSHTLENFWRAAAKGFAGSNLRDLFYYWIVIGGGYTGELYKKFKLEEIKAAQLESQLIESELRALKQQLHPHFLFNTMNTIAVLVREGKNDDAVRLLAQLSSLLRMSLDQTRVQEVTLQEEMDFINRYVEIQQARFMDRLKVKIDISADALRARIPTLILQPIVENAILHGIAKKSTGGTVEISAGVKENRLWMEVRDDGPGFPEHFVREGIGLSNTRERLSKRYGKKQEMNLRSEPGRGVNARIVLPLTV